MESPSQEGVYARLGVKRVVNAVGSATVLGGSMPSSKVRAAMEQAGEYFVEMEELLDMSGKAVASLLGCESALVTSGCFAAQVLGAAAIMTGADPDKMRRLPDTGGMKDEFLIQKSMRYGYDRCVTLHGGKLVEVGGESTTAQQLRDAIGPGTAGILYVARSDGDEGTVSLAEVFEIADSSGISVLVDAASEIYPLDRMTWIARNGGVVCFGAKYFGSPNSTGVLAGRKDLVEAAVMHNFVSFQTRATGGIGRGYKVDRQEVVGVVTALEEWLTANHEDRFAAQEQRIHTITRRLRDVPTVETELVLGDRSPWMRLSITVDEKALGKSARSVVQALKDGEPSIMVSTTSRMFAEGDPNVISLMVHTLRPGEDELLAERLHQELAR